MIMAAFFPRSLVAFLIASVLSEQSDAVGGTPASTSPWVSRNYPNPDTDPERCQTISGRLCDPDSVLTDADRRSVEDYLSEDRRQFSLLCNSQREHKALVEMQFAVALVKRMDLSTYSPHDEDRQDRGAEVFGRGVHDSWGVGVDTECGGTGLVLFLSDEDRAIYVSRGKALEAALTDRRLDQTIDGMKSLLRRRLYGDAVVRALQEAERHILAGPPQFWERVGDFIVNYGGFLFIALFIALIVWGIRKEHEDRRAYAQVASHLNELDRARAEALQGRFRAVSCPICLEDFQSAEEGEREHQDGGGGGGGTTANDESSGDIPGNADTALLSGRKGSDGLPLKLLRCGHVFDETCWNEWVHSGRGHVDRCPICQQNVSGRAAGDDDPAMTTSERMDNDNLIDMQRERGSGTTREQASFRTENNEQERALLEEQNRHLREERALQERNMQLRDENDRILRQYNRERNFRLARLGARYPRFIRPQQIQRWTQSTYDGTLARDQSFVKSDPSLRAPGSSSGTGGRRGGSGSGFGGSGFGGGSSAGGRGGRW